MLYWRTTNEKYMFYTSLHVSCLPAATEDGAIRFAHLNSPAVVGAEPVWGRASGEGRRSDSATPDVTTLLNRFHSLHLQ